MEQPLLQIQLLAQNIEVLETIAKNAKDAVLKKEPLSNFDILKLLNDLKMKYFGGVFMKGDLRQKFSEVERGIKDLENHNKSIL